MYAQIRKLKTAQFVENVKGSALFAIYRIYVEYIGYIFPQWYVLTNSFGAQKGAKQLNIIKYILLFWRFQENFLISNRLWEF